MARWKIETLGFLRARAADGRLIERFRTRRCALLLAFFAVSPRLPYSRETIGEVLWPESPPERQRSRLRNELSNLHRAFGGEEILQRVGNEQLILAPDVVSDAALFEKTFTAAAHQADKIHGIWLLREAIALYAGDLLPGFYDTWTQEQRERFRALFRKALLRLIDLLHETQDATQTQFWRGRFCALFPDEPEPHPPFAEPKFPVSPSRPALGGPAQGLAAVRNAPSHPYPSGSLLVACFSSDSLCVLDTRGARLAEVRSPHFSEPWGITRDESGFIYVGNRATSTICRLSPSLEERVVLASLPVGSDPFGLIIDREGRLLVASGRTGQIRRFSPTGEDLGIFAERGVYHPRSLVACPNGEILVTSAFRSVICRYGPEGDFRGLFAQEDIALPHGLAVDGDGHIYVSNVGTGTIQRFSPDGTNLGVFASLGVCSPAYLTFDAAGNLYVSCAGTKSVRVFLPSGAERGVFADDLANPAGLLFLP